MSVVSVAGATFTVTLNSTAYTDQVTTGTISIEPVIERTKTLGGVAFTKVDANTTTELEFLYDDTTGMYGALETAAAAGTGVTVSIDGGTGVWTGTAYIEKLDAEFAADGPVMCKTSMSGMLTFA